METIKDSNIQNQDRDKNKSKDSKKNIEWIEVAPHGLVGGMDPELSVIVFKEKKGEKLFAIWVSKLQSQIAFEQSVQKENTFSFLESIFQSINIFPKKCYFVDDKNGTPDVRVVFEGEKNIELNMKANEIVVFCIYYNCQFFCTEKFMNDIKKIKHGVLSKHIRRNSSISLN